MKAITTLLSSLFLSLLLVGHAAAGKDPVYTSYFNNNGAGGYDVTAYFSENEAVKGNKKFKAEYMGAQWLFTSQENLDKFTASPEAYAPQYGGYCAYAAAINATASGDPEQWSIYDGKLYLNYDKSVKEMWDGNKVEYIAKSDMNWPGLIK